MDAIKKKLVALREETDRAVAKANAAEEAANAANQRAEETEEKQRKLQKKLSEKENRLEVLMEDLLQAEIKAEEKEKLFHVAEQDIKQSERTIILKEAEVYRYTVVAERVRYFVLLNYSFKSWSIIKTRDSFRICLS